MSNLSGMVQAVHGYVCDDGSLVGGGVGNSIMIVSEVAGGGT
jgi:hypothetical protein